MPTTPGLLFAADAGDANALDGSSMGEPRAELPPGLTNIDETASASTDSSIGDLSGVAWLRSGLRADFSGVPPNCTLDLNGELIMAGERSRRRMGLRPPPGVCSVPPGVSTMSTPCAEACARPGASVFGPSAPSGERSRLWSVGLGVGWTRGLRAPLSDGDFTGVHPGGCGPREVAAGLSIVDSE